METHGLEGKRFLHIPRPTTVRARLEELKGRDDPTYNAMKYFLDEAVPSVPGLRVDDTLSATFNILYRDFKGSGFVFLWPNGNLGRMSEQEIVRKHGASVSAAAKTLGQTVAKALPKLDSKQKADELVKALRGLTAVLSKTERVSGGSGA